MYMFSLRTQHSSSTRVQFKTINIMTSSKTTATLTAIYNLKFYRKQNSWKLNAPIRKENEEKEKLSTSLRNKLNETYIITDKVREESPEKHPLNVAFFEPEKEQEVRDPKQALSQQWLEPLNIYPESVTKSEQNICSKYVENDNLLSQEIKKKACVHERLEVLLKAAKEHEDARSELALENIAQENVPESYDFNLEEDSIIDNIWLPPEIHQTVYSEPWTNPDHDVIDGLNRQARPDGDWDGALFNRPSAHPPSTSKISLNEAVDDSALESSTEFMRGAHNAPHSSEVDIALPPEFMFGTLSSNFLRNLNAHKLAQALSDSAMFVTLMAESGRKPEQSVMSDCGSYDEYPTRDVGPFPNGDKFVAGSHLALCKRETQIEFGRGRGRLIQSRQRF